VPAALSADEALAANEEADEAMADEAAAAAEVKEAAGCCTTAAAEVVRANHRCSGRAAMQPSLTGLLLIANHCPSCFVLLLLPHLLVLLLVLLAML